MWIPKWYFEAQEKQIKTKRGCRGGINKKTATGEVI